MSDAEHRVVRLPKGSDGLLREIVVARVPQLLPVVSAGRDLTLTPSQIQELQEAITSELAYSGFDEAYEPTARGRMMEAIIDACTSTLQP